MMTTDDEGEGVWASNDVINNNQFLVHFSGFYKFFFTSFFVHSSFSTFYRLLICSNLKAFLKRGFIHSLAVKLEFTFQSLCEELSRLATFVNVERLACCKI